MNLYCSGYRVYWCLSVAYSIVPSCFWLYFFLMFLWVWLSLTCLHCKNGLISLGSVGWILLGTGDIVLDGGFHIPLLRVGGNVARCSVREKDSLWSLTNFFGHILSLILCQTWLGLGCTFVWSEHVALSQITSSWCQIAVWTELFIVRQWQPEWSINDSSSSNCLLCLYVCQCWHFCCFYL